MIEVGTDVRRVQNQGREKFLQNIANARAKSAQKPYDRASFHEPLSAIIGIFSK